MFVGLEDCGFSSVFAERFEDGASIFILQIYTLGNLISKMKL